MSQFDYIKEIARYGLENDQESLTSKLNELIEHSKKTKKVNFAIQLQSILKESLSKQKTSSLTKFGSDAYHQRIEDKELSEIILEKLTSDYSLKNLVAEDKIIEQLHFFLKEHTSIKLLQQFDLPVSNKVLLHGPSGCGKTLASYVIAGELKKLMYVVNLGAIVSSKLGDTSKNLAKLFRRAASEECIIFIDEFDSIGKLRDYNQDHGEMKRVVNTILQLFDYLPQKSIVIAATNQKDMIDEALLRRFDLNIAFPLPDTDKIKDLINLTLKSGQFQFDKPRTVNTIIKKAVGLSYYSIQKTLITAIKRSIFEQDHENNKPIATLINTKLWGELVDDEKIALSK
jgi:AAA+ superfamily predicted ATPase